MSLAHLHMTYAAAATNSPNNRLGLFNNGVPFHHPSASSSALPAHHLIHNGVGATPAAVAAAAASLSAAQYQNHHQNYLNYQHYQQQQQQQLQSQSSSSSSSSSSGSSVAQYPNQFLQAHQRSTFAIQEILGLNVGASSSASLFGNMVPSELAGQHHANSPIQSSSTNSSLTSPGCNLSASHPSGFSLSEQASFSHQLGSQAEQSHSSNGSSSESSQNLLNRAANEAAAAAAAAAAYGAYFSRGGFMANFASPPTTAQTPSSNNESSGSNNAKANLNSNSSGSHSGLSDEENENEVDEDSFGNFF